MLVLFVVLLGLNFFHSLFPALAKDPLKDMDLSLLTEETSVEDTTQFLSINGYLESRNQVRVKDVDEPISLSGCG